MSVRVMKQFPVREARPPSCDFRAALVGCGLTGAMIGVLAPEAHLDLIDFDHVEPRQTILSPFPQPGRPKAAMLQEYRRARFPWLGPERSLLAAAEDIGDGYWRHLAREGALVLACTDAIATQTHLARVARRHGLAMVATGLGPDAVEVLAAPAGREQACYACLGRNPEQPPAGCFLDGIDAVEANAPEPPPTNSTLHQAALVAATAIEETQALAAGAREHTEMMHLAPGQPVLRARVARRADCPVCGADDGRSSEQITSVSQGTGDIFEAILDALGVDAGEAEVALPAPAARAVFCPDCGRYTELPHLLLGRRVRCGGCGSADVLAAERIPSGTAVPLADALERTPAELGWPWWPIIEIRCGATGLLVELAGDAAEPGEVVTIEPVTVGERDAH